MVASACLAPAGVSAAVPTQWLAKVSTEAQGRSPTPEWWRSWSDYYAPERAGCSVQTLAALGRATYTGPGFLALDYDNAARLLALYRGAVNREPSELEAASSVSALNDGNLGWDALVDSVFDSAEFGSLASAICAAGDPNYSFSPVPPVDLGRWSHGITSRVQQELQAALDDARGNCGTVALRPREVVFVGGDQPGKGEDNSPLAIPPCVTLTTLGAPDPHHYANMGRLVLKGQVCGSSMCNHSDVVRVGDGARLANVWVDGSGADPRNLKTALVAAASGDATTEIVGNRLSDPPPDGTAIRAEGYGTSGTPCSRRSISGNLITGYATKHARSRLGAPLSAGGISVFCEQARVEENELVDVSDTGIVVHGSWNSDTEERRTQRSRVSGNRIVSAGISANVALGADAVGECRAEGDGPPVDCIEFSHDRGGDSAERSFEGTSIAANTFWTGSRTHFDIGLMVGSKAIWGDNGPFARGVSFTDNTTAGIATRAHAGIATSGMFEADVRGNSETYDVIDTNPSASEGKCARGEVVYGLGLATFTPGSQPANGVDGLSGCLVDHPPAGGMERIEIGAGQIFVGADSGQRFTPWGQNGGLDHLLDVFDLREVKQMGANIVRLHLQFKDIMASCTAADPAALAELDRTLRLAEENGVYLDLTGLASYAGDDHDPDCYRHATEAERWSAQEAFWRAVSARVAESPAVFALNIMSEPVVPGTETPCWAGPAPPERPNAPGCREPFGGYFFAPNITRTPRGRSPEAVGHAWLERMTAAIRAHDREHLVTLGCVGFTRCVGLTPAKLASLLDYLSIHVYPSDCTGSPPPGNDPCALKGRNLERSSGDPLSHERALLATYASGGDPVVVEETFPLRGGADLVRNFILGSRPYATGWLGQWGQLTISQHRAIGADHLLWHSWGRVFQRLTGNLYAGRPRDRHDADAAEVETADRGAAPVGGRGVGGGEAGGDEPAVADRTLPELRSLRVSPRRFAVERRGSLAARRRAKRGTTFRYWLSEEATVTIAIQRRSLGRRVGGRCRRPSRRHRGSRRCSRFRTIGGFSVRGRRGRNRTPFSGRLTRRKSLSPGRYRLVTRAIDAEANRSKRRRARFEVARLR